MASKAQDPPNGNQRVTQRRDSAVRRLKQRQDQERASDDNGKKALKVVAGLLIVGAFAVVAYAISRPTSWSIAMTGLMLAGASTLTGGLAGFLFGIPRTGPEGDATKSFDPPSPGAPVRANTNLEQISDWLTKIIVGVGLVEFGALSEALSRFGKDMGPAFGDTTAGPLFVQSCVLFFGISGFLLGFIWTRIFMHRALSDLEEGFKRETKEALSNLTEQVEKIETNYERDGRAFTLTMMQLDSDNDEVSGELLRTAYNEATETARKTILDQVAVVHDRSWREGGARLRRCIPVYEALLQIEGEKDNYRLLGRLGSLYTDLKPEPDWAKASEYLDKAIELGMRRKDRDPSFSYNRLLANLNRHKGTEITSEVRAKIDYDLDMIKNRQRWMGYLRAETSAMEALAALYPDFDAIVMPAVPAPPPVS